MEVGCAGDMMKVSDYAACIFIFFMIANIQMKII
jgi:hypothetical protein